VPLENSRAGSVQLGFAVTREMDHASGVPKCGVLARNHVGAKAHSWVEMMDPYDPPRHHIGVPLHQAADDDLVGEFFCLPAGMRVA
jgi:hypothetical protein